MALRMRCSDWSRSMVIAALRTSVPYRSTRSSTRRMAVRLAEIWLWKSTRIWDGRRQLPTMNSTRGSFTTPASTSLMGLILRPS